MNTGFQQIIELLESSSVAYQLHYHPPLRSVADVEQNLPELAAQMMKTVAFRVKDNGYVLAAVDGRSRIDYKKLADYIGVSRRQLRALSPAEVEAELGFEVGGVAPFTLTEDVRLIVDSDVSARPVVHTGSGKNTVTLSLAPADLERLGRVDFAPISK